MKSCYRWARLASVLFVTVTVPVTRPAAPWPGGTGYHVIKKISVGGEGFWDYLALDSEARRLYISRATHVMVLDADSGDTVGDIPNTEGVHGIVLVPELGRGFTSNGRSATVTIFDLKTLKEIKRVNTTGQNPDAIIYDPASRRVFTFNGRGGNSTAIEAATGNVAGTIDLGGRPEFAAADARGKGYVHLDDKSMVVVFDSQNLKLASRWPLAPCEEPSGMAMDREHRRLFIGCHNQMMAGMDADRGRGLATLPIGRGRAATPSAPGAGLS